MPRSHTQHQQVPIKPATGLAPEDLIRMYYFMHLTREFESALYKLFQQGKIVGGAYSGLGNEATSVGSAYALQPGDYCFPMHRDLGAHFVRGQSIERIALQFLGRADGMTRGRDGTGHYADTELRIIGNISHLGAMVPVAAGAALASRVRGESFVAMTYVGDGGSNVGEVHEGLAMASVMKLPLILIIENNQYAYSTPVAKQFAGAKFSDRALGYGIPGVTVDGTDILAVYEACRDAVTRARKGDGPTIIESVTMRMSGHAAHDTAWYVPKELLESWKARDPIGQFEQRLLTGKVIDKPGCEKIAADIRAAVAEAMKTSLARPYPSGDSAVSGVYHE
jgi:TPP-dependent pyruvate/acetoin dehydrogenase alpha subunit